MEKEVGSSSAQGVSPDDLAGALGRLAVDGGEKNTICEMCRRRCPSSELCPRRCAKIRAAAKQGGYDLCPVCHNYWRSVPDTRFNEVHEGLWSAICEMENAGNHLKNLAAKLSSVSEVFCRINDVVHLLDSAVQCSREVYADRSPALSDVRSHWEEVWRLEDEMNGKTDGKKLVDCHDEDSVDSDSVVEKWDSDD